MQDEKSGIAGGWHERIQNIRYHNSQAISMKKSCLNINVEKEAGRKPDGIKNDSIFTGSLAEVYEKALANVLNIQPHVKMDENDREKEITLVDKKLMTGPIDSRHFVPPAYSISGTYKHTHNEKYLSPQQNIAEVKKLNTTNKSAFHVPEKRRTLSNGLSRPTNWSHDAGPLPYPVNYPADYYPVIHPPPFYARGSPYHNVLIDRMKFYPVPRGGECPPLTHVLPWTPFERDFKPWTSPRYYEWRPKRTLRREPETKCHDKTLAGKPTCDKRHPVVVPRPCARQEKTADTEGLMKSSTCEPAGGETTNKSAAAARVTPSHLENNVRTRRMRAFQKRNEFSSKENKKETFDSPKEEFLFRLGLTRVH